MLSLEEMRERVIAPGAPPERWLEWKRHFERGAPPELTRLAREHELDAKRVLDVGCGLGVHLLHFAPFSVGIDRAPDRVEFARSIGLTAEVRDVDTLGWNLGLGDFDVVWIANLLGELEDPKALLASLPSVLAPKGRVLLFERVWPRNARTARLVARGVAGGRDAYDALPPRARLTEERLTELVSAAGFEIEREWSHAVGSPALERLLRGVLVPRTIQLRPRRDAPAPSANVRVEKRKSDVDSKHVLRPHRADPVRRVGDLARRRGEPDRVPGATPRTPRGTGEARARAEEDRGRRRE